MCKNYLSIESEYFKVFSSYDFTIEEQKLILLLANMLKKTDKDSKIYKVNICEFMKLLENQPKVKYTKMQDIIRQLMKKSIDIQEGDSITETKWINGAIYKEGTGCVELVLSPYLKTYMLNLKGKYTNEQLGSI
ncbi:replication initiation protein [Clostridium oceanicum]|uniref:Initiator Rep protein WH1 domain-containing protein n=1 Tax=Clostridium oceanicum TaxID=1543 RepID=A0ABN1J876_9CLOT